MRHFGAGWSLAVQFGFIKMLTSSEQTDSVFSFFPLFEREFITWHQPRIH